MTLILTYLLFPIIVGILIDTYNNNNEVLEWARECPIGGLVGYMLLWPIILIAIVVIVLKEKE